MLRRTISRRFRPIAAIEAFCYVGPLVVHSRHSSELLISQQSGSIRAVASKETVAKCPLLREQ